MKNSIKPLLAGLLLFVPIACARAQTNSVVDVSNASAARGQSGDVVALCASFGMPVLIVGMALFFKYRKDRLTHDTVRAMVEKGVPITPELIGQLVKKDPEASKLPNQSRHLLPGLIMVAVGAALLISDHMGLGIPGLPGAGGWIILFVGVAFLIVWLVERNNKNDAQPPRA